VYLLRLHWMDYDLMRHREKIGIYEEMGGTAFTYAMHVCCDGVWSWWRAPLAAGAVSARVLCQKETYLGPVSSFFVEDRHYSFFLT
jgi:hypothetical protein